MTVTPPTPSGIPADAAPESGPRGQRIGVLLRRTREGHRVGLEDAAAALRIRATYIDAIEHGAYERLPGATYAVGFVRAYAEYLGLDGEEAVRRFKREGQGLDAQPDLSFPMPIAERSIPGGRILVTALVLAICGYGLWYYQTSGTHRQADAVAEIPAALLQLPDTGAAKDSASPGEARASVPAHPAADKPPAAAAAAPPATDNAAPPAAMPSAATAPAATAPAPLTPMAIAPAAPVSQQIAALTPPVASPIVAPAATPDSAAQGHGVGVADGPARIVLRITGDCWVQIRDAKQDIVFSKLLHPGDMYRVADQPGLTMKVGNSDGLTILLDGKKVTLPPGNSRVRTVALDPARLASGDQPATAPLPTAAPAAATSPPADE